MRMNEQNYLSAKILYSPHGILVAVCLVVSASISIIGIGPVAPQVSLAQQQQPQANFTSTEHNC